MARKLMNLVLDRIDLVDAPANPGAHVVLLKRDTKKDAPGVGAVHVDRPLDKAATKTEGGEQFPAAAYAYVPDSSEPSTWKLRLWQSTSTKETARQVGAAVAALGKGYRGQKVQIPSADLAGVKRKVLAAWRKVNPDASTGDVPSVLKRSRDVKKSLYKQLQSAIADVFKGDDGDDDDDAQPASKSTVAYDALKAHHAQLGDAIKAFGDTSKLAADHPAHTMKAMQDELTKAMTACEAAAQPPTDDDGDDDFGKAVAEPYGPQTGKPGVAKRLIAHMVAKQMEPVQKALDEANARATTAETIAKAERDARALDGVKVELKKFDRLSLDVEKEAPKYAALKSANAELYASQMETLKGANERLAAASVLETEIGSSQGGGDRGPGAWAEIEAEAAKIVEKGDGKMTKHKAIDIVMKKRPDLVRKHEAETRAH